ncbi:MAG: AtpZ/AtpI family protein [Deltaproteobacteria bacterium]|nr:AtpZ/AtpI family protein [Deltaproteobacteria bacterium]
MAKDNQLYAYAKYSAIGIEFAVAAIVGIYGGSYIDSHFGSSPWGVLLGAILCLASGFYRLVISLQQMSAQREQQDDRKN